MFFVHICVITSIHYLTLNTYLILIEYGNTNWLYVRYTGVINLFRARILGARGFHYQTCYQTK